MNKRYIVKWCFPLLGMLFSLASWGQNGNNFSVREKMYVRVATPGLMQHGILPNIDLRDSIQIPFVFPLKGGKVISPYGRHGRHSGCDIKTFAKDTIYAVFDGVVRMSRKFAGYGNVIVIRHPFGLETVYSHNYKNFVQPGDSVKAGTPVGLTGRTGRATTEHVHFEMRYNGNHFNPATLIDMKNYSLYRKEYKWVGGKKGFAPVSK